MLFLPMKNQSLAKKLYKPVHPMLGKAALGAGILLAVAALVFVFQQRTITSPTTTTPPPGLTLSTMPTSTAVQLSSASNQTDANAITFFIHGGNENDVYDENGKDICNCSGQQGLAKCGQTQ
jgi:hypothetical protein